MPDSKEPHFFLSGVSDIGFAGPADSRTARQFFRDAPTYRSLFDSASPEQIVGEASTAYLYSRQAAQRMSEIIPAARIVVLVRHPVHRAASAFSYLRSMGLEPSPSIHRALSVEPERRRSGWSPIYWYVGASEYSRYVPTYQELFGLDCVHIVAMEELVSDPGPVLDGLCTFLGIPPHSEALPSLNRSGVPHFRPLYSAASRPNPVKDRLKECVPPGLRLRLRAMLEAKLLQSPEVQLPRSTPLDLLIEQEAEFVETYLGRALTAWKR